MTLLHDYFHLRNHQAFQRLLDGNIERGQSGSVPSSSGGKSWTRPSPLASGAVCDINARDWLGRTVLHLACAAPDTVEYVRILLRHSAINVNLVDTESHWTPLHRALYNANLPTALLLLQRSDTDRSLQDLEGYTAFDLYNSTLNGTKPSRDTPRAELYTWGTNRNAALGFVDGGDRVHPERVVIPKKDGTTEPEKANLISRFFPTYVREIQMSKLHTAVITSESGGNLRLCGFGSGGRLGPGQHTQYSFKSMQNLSHTITSIALGQDHTLALTKTGEVLTWGLNRFSQLGYVIDGPGSGESFGKTEEPIQATPRKVLGPLRKEVVKGVATSKTASACWTDADVYTWGTNNGQLGYDKAAQPIQVLPRKATKVTEPVNSITITDSAMVCLLDTHDVICIWNDRHMKILFPRHAFPSEMQPYRPPQAIQDAKIAKIRSSDDTFAALSFSGELFTFSVANPSEASVASVKERSGFKPQRVWALRKKFSSVKDVALGSDGSIIVCTESGHVFVRSRNLKGGQTSASGKAFKFQRLPSLQRVTQVCANSTGAFGALRVEYQLKPIEICGNTFAQDFSKIQPYLSAQPVYSTRDASDNGRSPHSAPVLRRLHDDDVDDTHVENDTRKLQNLIDILENQNKALNKPENLSADSVARFLHGADIIIQFASGIAFPAHRAILGARSPVLSTILSGSMTYKKRSDIPIQLSVQKVRTSHSDTIRLNLSGCQPISILIFLTFVYTDEVLAPWDHRVAAALKLSKEFKINVTQVKADLQGLAELLELPTLAATLDSPVKCTPTPALETAMQELFDSSQNHSLGWKSGLGPDVILQLSDREVYCHSAVLRARSEFFTNFFDEDEWTVKRWDMDGVIRINMKHLDWRVMDYVLRFMCYGSEERMFDLLNLASVDEVLEFIFDVMAAANELLLDRLILLCSMVVLQHINIHNACFVLAEATHVHAEQLTERIQSFIMVNMELFLEAGMLNDIPVYLLKQLAQFIREQQAEKSPVSRSGRLANEALIKHADWLFQQDIPAPIDRPSHPVLRKDSSNFKTSRPVPYGSPRQSPGIQPHHITRQSPLNDDIFAMDDADVPHSLIADHSQASIKPPNFNTVVNLSPTPVWKPTTTLRVDMKTVMAETANITAVRRPHDTTRYSTPVHNDLNTSRPQKQEDARMNLTVRPSPSATPLKEPIASRSSPRVHPIPQRSSGATPKVGLGPVIIPTRQTPSSPATPSLGSNIRRTSGKAWNQPTVDSFPKPAQPTATMSFAAIQQFELEQLAGTSQNDKRSIRDIQEEEQALQAEADFLTWWTAEEERIKLENQMAEMVAQSINKKSVLGAGPRRRGGKNKADQVRGESKEELPGQPASVPKRKPRKPSQRPAIPS